jgi:DNA ligase-1
MGENRMENVTDLALSALVRASAEATATRSRLAKRRLLADCLREAGAGQAALVVSYLSGRLPQGKIGLGPSLLRELDLPDCMLEAPALRLSEIDDAFTRLAGISGKGSKQARLALLCDLLARATPDERDFLFRLMLGELRQGALEGLLVDALAEASGLPQRDVRRAVMLAGDAAAVAEPALREAAAGLEAFRLEPLSPVQPMLAQPAETMAAALDALGEAGLEYKLDGARVQIHKRGSELCIYSRRLNDVTASLPEIVAQVSALPATDLILDGEVIALRGDGRPLPFQVTMRRFGRKSDVAGLREQIPLSLFLFDCLHRDGEDLIDQPADERYAALRSLDVPRLLVPRLVTGDRAQAQTFLRRALDEGHEGLMAKALGSPYAAGSRGADWLKIKQVHSLDLVVLAAEWGSGRRKGYLSNLHLGARDPATGGFVMLGKTFKGLTDKLLDWQTRALLELETTRDKHTVYVEPKLLVEIALNDIQASPQYPAGLALRFARVKRYRPDKTADQADTIDAVRALYAAQHG